MKNKKIKKKEKFDGDNNIVKKLDCNECGKGLVITTRLILRNGQKKYLSVCNVCGKRFKV